MLKSYRQFNESPNPFFHEIYEEKLYKIQENTNGDEKLSQTLSARVTVIGHGFSYLFRHVERSNDLRKMFGVLLKDSNYLEDIYNKI